MSAVAAPTGGDPRRPSDAVVYRRPASEAGTDSYGFVAVLLGAVGMILKISWFSWASLAFSLSSYVQGNPDVDVKSLMMSVMFSLYGIFQSFAPAAAATNSTIAATVAASVEATASS